MRRRSSTRPGRQQLLCTVCRAPRCQQLPCVIPSAPGGAFGLDDKRTENKVSGTAVISYKPTDRLLTYASYSRGYKAGGFNLDRSALWRAQPIRRRAGDARHGLPSAASGSGAICVSAARRAARASSLRARTSVQAGNQRRVRSRRQIQWPRHRHEHRGCSTSCSATSSSTPSTASTSSSKTSTAAATTSAARTPTIAPRTGACTGKTRAGVRSQGFELEAFTRPMPNLAINGGLTLCRHQVSQQSGRRRRPPLDQCLFQLPGRRISNAPQWTATGSVAWTPPIGGAGIAAWSMSTAAHEQVTTPVRTSTSKRPRTASRVFNGRVGIHGPDDTLGDRTVGAEPVRQELSAGRVRRAGRRARARRAASSAGLLSRVRPSCSARSSASRARSA